MRSAFAPLLVVGLLAAGPASAHKPSFSINNFSGLEAPYVVEDIDHSIVVYQDISCDAGQAWLTFDNPRAGKELFVQLGVPKIARLADYRPRLAVVARGLPAPDGPVPFAVPPGMGVLVLTAEEPRLFHEAFTGTDSWILVERRVALPDAGAGYLVAWDPDSRPGKLWVAVGEEERFGLGDLLRFVGWRAQARAFHEVGAPDKPAPGACTFAAGR